MLSSSTPVAFVPSTDLDRSRRFYEGILGLPVLHADAFALALESGGMTVRVTNVGEQLRVQPFTAFGWEVDDVHGEMARLVDRGIEFLRVSGMDQDDDGVWTAPDGTQVA